MRAIDNLLRHLDSRLAGVVQRHQDRGGHETDRRAAGPLRLGVEIVVVAPAAVDALVADRACRSAASIRARILRQRSWSRACRRKHVQQGIDANRRGTSCCRGRRPNCGGPWARAPSARPRPDRRHGATSGLSPPTSSRAEMHSEVTAAAKRLVGAGHGGINLLRPAAPLGAPRAVGVLPLEQEAHAAADRRFQFGGGHPGDRLRLRPGHGRGSSTGAAPCGPPLARRPPAA